MPFFGQSLSSRVAAAQFRLQAMAWTLLFLAALLGLAGGAGFLVAGRAGALGAILGVVGFGYAAARYAADFVLRASRAMPLAAWQVPDLWSVLQRLSDKAGVPLPRLWLIPSDRPNAFTVGRGPHSASIALTTGLLENLDLRHVTGVLAHEVAHIRHRDILLASFAATVTSLLASAARLVWLVTLLALPFLVLWAPQALFAALLISAAPVLALLLQAAMSRQREYAADVEASRLTQDPLGLAHALLRLQEFEMARRSLLSLLTGRPSSGDAGSPLHSHPSTRKRVDRLIALSR